LMITSVLLFFVAIIFLFHLFIPVRYLHYGASFPLFLFLILFIVKVLRKARVVQYIMLSAIIVLSSMSVRNRGLVNLDHLEEVYHTIDALDEQELLIAGNPYHTSSIPYFNSVSVLTSYEASHLLYYRNYWYGLKERTFDFFQAYFSKDKRVLFQFIKKYDLNYILIADNDLQERCSLVYFPPFNDQIKELYSGEQKLYLKTKEASKFITNIDKEFSMFNCQMVLEQSE
jgi:hypothetical protein